MEWIEVWWPCVFECKELEPAGGFERSVSRLRFGCSALELHRLIVPLGVQQQPARLPSTLINHTDASVLNRGFMSH